MMKSIFYINIRPQKRFNGKTPAQVRKEAESTLTSKRYRCLLTIK